MLTFFRRLRARLKYRHFDRDLAQELETHRAMAQEHLEAKGLSASEARTAAARALGNVTYMREEARAVWLARWLEQLWQDVRYALRGVRQHPGFSAAAVLILALGVGSLTVNYSIVNARLLRPWQVPSPESVMIIRAQPGPQQQYGTLGIDEILYLAEHATTVSALSTFMRGGERIDDDERTVQSEFVTASYFDVLGIRLATGPGLSRGSDGRRNPREVVISHDLWQGRFDGDPAIVGRTVRLSDVPFTVVGVAEEGFVGVHYARVELWLSLNALGDGTMRLGAAVARRKPGITRSQALAELEVLSQQFREATGVQSFGLLATDTRPIRAQTSLLLEYALTFAGLSLVLILTCANVGSLIFARALARRNEVAVRLSLGASRLRVARQFLTETLVLALGAGAIGVALATALPRVTIALTGSTLLRPEYLAPDWTVAVFALAVALVATLLAGAAAVGGIRHLNWSALGARDAGGTRRPGRSLNLLLITQVTVTVVFLTAASLVTHAVNVAGNASPGFAVDDVSVVELRFQESESGARRSALTRELNHAVSLAGLHDVAFASSRPLIQGASNSIRVYRPGEHVSQARLVSYRSVSANYFSVMEMPVLEGVADFHGEDDTELVVNEAFAKSSWPGESPIGKRLIHERGGTPTEAVVVGVVRDVPIRTPGQVEPVIYGHTDALPVALVSTHTSETLERLRTLSRAIEPTVTLVATPMRQLVRESFSEMAVAGRVGWITGGATLLIAMLGIFGLFSYSVEQRRREIGIRIALGGHATHVTREILRSGQRAVTVGTTLGFLLCLIAASLLRHELFGLEPLSPVAYGQVAALIAIATLLAVWLPARRAVRVDPAVALRSE